MLSHLRIENFALIEQLDLEWKEGFTTITGETGAGKSIMLGALNHLLGQRADLKALKDPERKCIIEGQFNIDESAFLKLFEELDLDFDPETIIRREILPSGKSRAFVNDSPVRLDALQSLGQHLIDIHSQHDTLLLNDPNFQLGLIDSFGKHEKELANYQESFKEWKKALKEITALETAMREEGGDLDYLEFLHQELVDAQLIPGEGKEIEERLDLLEHSGKIESALSRVQEMSDASPYGIAELLSNLRQELNSISNYDKALEDFASRAESLIIEFNDLKQEIEAYGADSQFDPQEKERLDQRLSQLIHLQRKHQSENIEDLIARREALSSRMSAAADRDIQLGEAKKKVQSLEDQLKKEAQTLSEQRRALKASLESEVLAILIDLNIPDAQFEIRFQSNESFEMMGTDRIEFLFSANRGQSLNSLQKVASGGELSRVMLALKSILAQSKSLPTIIFDEIDTGVSGETAFKIGSILQGMGQYMQVVSITHLAQIAAGGKQHYLVQKQRGENSSRSEIIELNEEARLNEIARLLGGDQISEAALANARELIQAN